MTSNGWLLDTNVLSELRKGVKAVKPVRLWAAENAETGFFISDVTLAEVKFGVDATEAGSFRDTLAAWLQDIRVGFAQRTLRLDEAVLVRWLRLCREGQKDQHTFPQTDALLACTALVHGLGVATRNVRDFERTGVRLVNPWFTRVP